MNGNSGAGIVIFLLYIALLVIVFASFWKIYVKAGRKGWEGIVPIYNIYILMGIIGRPTWWLILYFIPFVNIVISIIVAIDLAKSFGKGTWFGAVWLWALSLIGYIYLAFGKTKYVGPSVKTATTKPASTPQAQTPEPTTNQTPTKSNV